MVAAAVRVKAAELAALATVALEGENVTPAAAGVSVMSPPVAATSSVRVSDGLAPLLPATIVVPADSVTVAG